MNGDSWYFAYGSNLLTEQKARRAHDERIRVGDERPRIATLEGYRLAFNKRSQKSGEVFANIVPCAGEEVIGVVYRWGSASRAIMREQFEVGYREQMVKVTTELDEALDAVTFVAESPCEEGRPTPRYLDKIVNGAREHGLPEEYIEKIQTIARQAV